MTAMEQLDSSSTVAEMQDAVYLGCCNKLALFWKELETIGLVLDDPQAPSALRRAARHSRRVIFKDSLELLHSLEIVHSLEFRDVHPLELHSLEL